MTDENEKKIDGIRLDHIFMDEPFEYGTDGSWPDEVAENLRYEPDYEFKKDIPFEFRKPDPDLERMRALRWKPAWPTGIGEERLMELNQKPRRRTFDPDFNPIGAPVDLGDLTEVAQKMFPGITLRPAGETTEDTTDNPE